jgi:hypothetical protein
MNISEMQSIGIPVERFNYHSKKESSKRRKKRLLAKWHKK